MPDYETLNLIRLILVLALVVTAAALATPKDRVPLALRGIVRLLTRDTAPSTSSPRPPSRPSPFRRLLAFVLVLLALAFALIMV